MVRAWRLLFQGMLLGSATRNIRVLIADDHPVFREGLRLLLEMDPSVSVVGEARDGKQAVDLALQLKPNLLLMDLRMPRASGLEALRLIRQLSIPVRVLILATEVERPDIVEALKRGAAGIILKESTTQLLRKSIHAVMAGEYWVQRESVSDLVQELTHRPGGAIPETPEKHWRLTPRELQIVSEIMAGKTNKEIALELNLSAQTVKHHLTNIFDKVGVHNRLELALFSAHHMAAHEQELEGVGQAGTKLHNRFPRPAADPVLAERVGTEPDFVVRASRQRSGR